METVKPEDDASVKAQKLEAKLLAAEELRLKRAAKELERVANHNKMVAKKKQ